MGITKSDFMRGVQCPKMLWLDKHKPGLRIISPEVQRRLDAGNDFGDRAMAMFGPYEEMTILKPGTQFPDTKAMVAKTADHISRGTKVICEAAFSYYNNYCAVDILRKTESGYDFYEVKNSPVVKDQFIKDTGFQYYILKKSKINVGKIFVVTHGNDEENPFVINEVSEEAKAYYKWIDENIWELNRKQKEAEELMVEVGEQCSNPYECWYYNYCHNQ
ncbi:hypothetical protein D6855_14215 [Butyrivibrio sp. CB08]|uniref:hypothetical protein n=1 Tax=Butyrivibrio sp. CB08 TaxID=2364879 RepID=UPI000EA8C84F|nr:hypothetical protein [Butyrivibrio sp. CB08]RKM56819.1 hypothetical protein D6855_14215 [Butyrivibrio sp. CB08]